MLRLVYANNRSVNLLIKEKCQISHNCWKCEIFVFAVQVEENPDFAAVDPALLEEDAEERVRISDYGRVIVPSEEEMMAKTRELDNDQRRVLDITIKYAKDIVKARGKGKAGPDPPHLLVHGTAGTGDMLYNVQDILNALCLSEYFTYLINFRGKRYLMIFTDVRY